MTQRRKYRPPYLLRLIRGRPRLFGSLAVGAGFAFFLPGPLRLAPRLLAGWDLFIVLYLALASQIFARSDAKEIRRHAAIQDEGRLGILLLTSTAALASVVAIIAELGSTAAQHSGRPPRQLALAVLTILLSWFFTHTIFALHYAHEFYSDSDGGGDSDGGLVFPGGDPPDYWDFVYFSFVIGMTCQVSDVGISERSIRRTATAHGVLAFVFNTAILALTVNIAASAL